MNEEEEVGFDVIFLSLILFICIMISLWNVVGIFSGFMHLTGVKYYSFQIIGCIVLYKLIFFELL